MGMPLFGMDSSHLASFLKTECGPPDKIMPLNFCFLMSSNVVVCGTTSQ